MGAVHNTSKHRVCDTTNTLARGKPLEPLCETERSGSMAGFIAGMIVGAMGGISIMCFVQINRAYRKDEEGE